MKIYKFISIILLALLSFSGCDLYEGLLDPTEVHNPSITDDNLSENATEGADPLLVGLRYSFSDAVMYTIIYTDIVSDNYDNTFTFLSNIIDDPRDITPSEQMLNDNREIYLKLHHLHGKAIFGLEVILPNDAEATAAQWAEVYYYKGMALLMLSENFAAFPIIENGPMVRSEDAIDIAIQNFETSIQYNPSYSNMVKCKYALARAHRLNGDVTNAALEANNALALSNNYVLAAQFDAVNLNNRLYIYAYIRAANDMQPLPRLDYLDPKYTARDSEIPVLKSEEAYLILAEVALFNGNFPEAKTKMINAINLSNSRGAITFTEVDKRTDRPNDPNMLVKADADAETIAGLITQRIPGQLTITYPISRTSVTEAYINSLTTSEQLYRALYLLRQEIFFLEGRRMSDLGIRLPVMQRQIDANANVNSGDYGTSVIVPAFIPYGYGLDEFTINGNIVTISYDMNKLIAQNISVVSPFK
ncbi:MAG: hypothetical protein JW866_07810 [Ignavibacteriales bacterium]|nr:hypothetical protein [Ignavibacteriales bacterium]